MEIHKERPSHLQQIGINNQRPNLPSFNKIAAKTIEPIAGASTCAFGNQIWTPNIGSFTAKQAWGFQKYGKFFCQIGQISFIQILRVL